MAIVLKWNVKNVHINMMFGYRCCIYQKHQQQQHINGWSFCLCFHKLSQLRQSPGGKGLGWPLSLFAWSMPLLRSSTCQALLVSLLRLTEAYWPCPGMLWCFPLRFIHLFSFPSLHLTSCQLSGRTHVWDTWSCNWKCIYSTSEMTSHVKYLTKCKQV